jgi:citrate lyase synthetase
MDRRADFSDHFISCANIRLLVWNITESHIRDIVTEETFKFISPTYEIMSNQLNPSIKT